MPPHSTRPRALWVPVASPSIFVVGYVPDTRRQRAVGSRVALRSDPCFCCVASVRITVYVDGFNLYYGAVKGTPFKWLNLVQLARQLVPDGPLPV